MYTLHLTFIDAVSCGEIVVATKVAQTGRVHRHRAYGDNTYLFTYVTCRHVPGRKHYKIT